MKPSVQFRPLREQMREGIDRDPAPDSLRILARKFENDSI
jgi:hypothetical protein